MKTVGVKYCGGCNPHIDRTKLALDIIRRLPSNFALAHASSPEPWEVGLLICGCPAACADRPDVKTLAYRWITIAGNSTDGETCPEDQIADAVVKKIKTLL